MSVFETLTLILSACALLVSVVALLRTQKTAAEQLRLGRTTSELAARQLEMIEEEASTAGRARLSARMTTEGRGRYSILIENLSDFSAKDVDLKFAGSVVGPLIEGEYNAKIPASVLQPHGQIRLVAVMGHDSARIFQANLYWTNTDGSRSVEELVLAP